MGKWDWCRAAGDKKCLTLLALPQSFPFVHRRASWALSVNVPKNYAFSVSYVSFATETSFDFFTAYDGSTIRSRTSGFSAPAGWISTSSYVRFTLTTDSSVVYSESQGKSLMPMWPLTHD
jgi:hypothetical protein